MQDFDDADDDDLQNLQKIAIRKYFKNDKLRLKEFRDEIIDRNLDDFGFILKEKDHNNSGTIPKIQMYQLLKQLFPTLGEGDVLSLVNYFAGLADVTLEDTQKMSKGISLVAV